MSSFPLHPTAVWCPKPSSHITRVASVVTFLVGSCTPTLTCTYVDTLCIMYHKSTWLCDLTIQQTVIHGATYVQELIYKTFQFPAMSEYSAFWIDDKPFSYPELLQVIKNVPMFSPMQLAATSRSRQTSSSVDPCSAMKTASSWVTDSEIVQCFASWLATPCSCGYVF